MAKNKTSLSHIVSLMNTPKLLFKEIQLWCEQYPTKYDALLILTRYPLETYIAEYVHGEIFKRAPMDIWETNFLFLTAQQQEHFLEHQKGLLMEHEKKIHSYPSMHRIHHEIRSNISLDKRLPFQNIENEEHICFLLKNSTITQIREHYNLYDKKELQAMLTVFYQSECFQKESSMLDKLFTQYAVLYNDPLLLDIPPFRKHSKYESYYTFYRILDIRYNLEADPSSFERQDWMKCFQNCEYTYNISTAFGDVPNMLRLTSKIFSNPQTLSFFKNFDGVDFFDPPGKFSDTRDYRHLFLFGLFCMTQFTLNEQQLKKLTEWAENSLTSFSNAIEQTRILTPLSKNPLARLLCFFAKVAPTDIPMRLNESELLLGQSLLSMRMKDLTPATWGIINMFIRDNHKKMQEQPYLEEECDLHF